MSTITKDALKAAGLQYGYSRTRRHPSVKPFIEGNHNGVDFINLEKTKEQLEAAISFLKALPTWAKPKGNLGCSESKTFLKFTNIP
jgi:ribosomal protein S2